MLEQSGGATSHTKSTEIELLNKENINPPTAIIYTDSRVALDSISNPNNHSFLVEEIRKKAANLEERE